MGLGVLGQISGEDEPLSLKSASTCCRNRATVLATQPGSLQMGLFTFWLAQATSGHPSGYQEKEKHATRAKSHQDKSLEWWQSTRGLRHLGRAQSALTRMVAHRVYQLPGAA